MGELLGPEGGADDASAAAVEADSTALGIALDRARSRRGKHLSGDDPADRLLTAQEALIADQRRHLREQARTIGLDRWSKRLRLALQGLTILVGLLALFGVGWLAWK